MKIKKKFFSFFQQKLIFEKVFKVSNVKEETFFLFGTILITKKFDKQTFFHSKSFLITAPADDDGDGDGWITCNKVGKLQSDLITPKSKISADFFCHNQCDQIWRYFDTLAIFDKSDRSVKQGQLPFHRQTSSFSASSLADAAVGGHLHLHAREQERRMGRHQQQPPRIQVWTQSLLVAEHLLNHWSFSIFVKNRPPTSQCYQQICVQHN